MIEQNSNRRFTNGESDDRVNEVQPRDHWILVLNSLLYLIAQLNEELYSFEAEALDDIFIAYNPDWIRNLKHLVNEILHFSSEIHFVELLIISWIAVIHLERIHVPQCVRLDETVMDASQTGFNSTQILMDLDIFTLELDFHLVDKRKYVGKEAIV
jgi:hypothetical protein